MNVPESERFVQIWFIITTKIHSRSRVIKTVRYVIGQLGLCFTVTISYQRWNLVHCMKSHCFFWRRSSQVSQENQFLSSVDCWMKVWTRIKIDSVKIHSSRVCSVVTSKHS